LRGHKFTYLLTYLSAVICGCSAADLRWSAVFRQTRNGRM